MRWTAVLYTISGLGLLLAATGLFALVVMDVELSNRLIGLLLSLLLLNSSTLSFTVSSLLLGRAS